MKTVCFVTLGVSLLATVVVAYNGPIGSRPCVRRIQGKVAEVNEEGTGGNVQQSSQRSRRGASMSEILDQFSKSEEARKFETVLVPEHHEDYLEQLHENPKRPHEYSKETTMRFRRSLDPNQNSHLNDSVYYRVHEVSNAIHLEPVIKQKPKKSSFDWVMRFLGKIMNTDRKDSIGPNKNLNPPKHLGPLIGPINFPGLGRNVYIRQLEPLDDETNHVVFHLVTRRPKVPLVNFRSGVNSPLDYTSIPRPFHPVSLIHLNHLYSLENRVPKFEKTSNLGLEGVDHHRHYQRHYQPGTQSFRKEPIYIPNYVQSTARYQSQRESPHQVRSMYPHKVAAHDQDNQLRNMAALSLLLSQDYQDLSLYPPLRNEADNTTKMGTNDFLQSTRTASKPFGNTSAYLSTDNDELRSPPESHLLTNYQQQIWPGQLVPSDRYVDGNVRNVDRSVRSENKEYSSGGGLEVVPAPRLDLESQSRLFDPEDVADGNYNPLSNNHRSNPVNYQSTWKTLKLEGSDSRNKVTVVDGVARDNDNSTIGHFQKVVVVDPHYSWSYEPKISKVVGNENIIKPVFETAEDEEERELSG